jgi:hypothetical protein
VGKLHCFLLLKQVVHIVAYRPVTGRDLEANNGMAAVAAQRRCKHISVTVELLLGKRVPAATGERVVVYAVPRDNKVKCCCLCGPRRGVIKRIELGQPVRILPCVDAGSNRSTVALQVVGGDEDGTQCLGV